MFRAADLVEQQELLLGFKQWTKQRSNLKKSKKIKENKVEIKKKR